MAPSRIENSVNAELDRADEAERFASQVECNGGSAVSPRRQLGKMRAARRDERVLRGDEVRVAEDDEQDGDDAQ
jgi:hypothetical protein